MAYFLDYPWRKNPRLMMLAFSGNLDEVEITIAFEDASSLMDQSTMPLHVVFDFLEAHVIEEFFDLLLHSRMVRHEQCGHCVFIDPDEFIAFTAKMLRSQIGTPVAIVDSEDDAWEFFSSMGIC